MHHDDVFWLLFLGYARTNVTGKHYLVLYFFSILDHAT